LFLDVDSPDSNVLEAMERLTEMLNAITIQAEAAITLIESYGLAKTRRALL
jgi:hypothetical protein